MFLAFVWLIFRDFTKKQKPCILRVTLSMHCCIITVGTSWDKTRKSLSLVFRRPKKQLTMLLEVRVALAYSLLFLVNNPWLKVTNNCIMWMIGVQRLFGLATEFCLSLAWWSRDIFGKIFEDLWCTVKVMFTRDELFRGAKEGDSHASNKWFGPAQTQKFVLFFFFFASWRCILAKEKVLSESHSTLNYPLIQHFLYIIFMVIPRGKNKMILNRYMCHFLYFLLYFYIKYQGNNCFIPTGKCIKNPLSSIDDCSAYNFRVCNTLGE